MDRITLFFVLVGVVSSTLKFFKLIDRIESNEPIISKQLKREVKNFFKNF